MKNRFRIIVLSVLAICLCACTGKNTVVSGKDNVLNVEGNYAVKAAEYLDHIAKNFNVDEDPDALREYIVDELIKAGYGHDQVERIPVELGMLYGENIVLSVKGKDSSKQIVVGAHYDSNGVGDNMSGVALVLGQAVGMASVTPAYDVKYIFFDLEEEGIYGAMDYVSKMSEEDIANTLYMINIDSVAFGDYACIYGGQEEDGQIVKTEAYAKAMDIASALGFNTYMTEDLDGYFAEHGQGPELDPKGVFTNPWTRENPSPGVQVAYSPSTLPVSDHEEFRAVGIPYIYFEATNWWAKGKDMDDLSYTGYYETANSKIGMGGMFMNTGYDTMANLEKYFPGRVMEHYNIYSPILYRLLTE